MSDLDDIYQITEQLYIGAYWPRLNFPKYLKQGIKAIVNLMEEKLYNPPRYFDYLYKGFPDETCPPEGYIEAIFNFIDEKISKNQKVLVHCAMGISRSGAICAGWLLKQNQEWHWTDAVEFVRKSRNIFPAVEIREAILDYLEAIEGRRRPY